MIALPLVLLGLVAAHLMALHEVGSNNPDGVEINKDIDPKSGHPLDGIPFHPYYTVKDIVGVAVFLIVFSAIVFFSPEMGGYFLEYNNFIPADPLKTPEHIAPVWYFTPFYAMLRAVPPMFGSQFPGVAVMGAATLILFLLPWLDRGKVKSIRYRGPKYKAGSRLFIVSFLCWATSASSRPRCGANSARACRSSAATTSRSGWRACSPSSTSCSSC